MFSMDLQNELPDAKGFSMPVIEEHLGEDGPAKTIITLPLVAKSSEKATKKGDEKKII